jgi:hypothetical protein
MLFSNFILILTLVITGHCNTNNSNWYSEIKPVDPAETKRLESQATLKGSVGGVQALLQIQQSVDKV